MASGHNAVKNGQYRSQVKSHRHGEKANRQRTIVEVERQQEK